MKKYIAIALAALSLTSCDDFLDREPMDFGNEDSYYKSPEDLRIAANAFYEYLPKNKELWGGLYTEDVQSDNQCSFSAQNLFYKGDKLMVKMGANCEWNFEHLRGINFFINKTKARIADGSVKGNKVLIDHFLGEGYFFRAYDYYRILRNYGDAPILREMLSDDMSQIAAASKRYPRNEVARFILADLDTAANLMQDAAPETGRITRHVALALKSRVALYEASWERYHAGTCFVPGNSKWPGANTWPNYSFPAGSAEAEVNFFLDQAIAASVEPSDKHPLVSDYAGMFNNWETEFPDGSEVLLARYYKSGILNHSCSAFLKSGGGCNATRALVNSYLMTNGLPIYAPGSNYGGDKDGYKEMQNRDQRLTQSVRFPGRVINTTVDDDGKVTNDTIYYYRPSILNTGNNGAPTGYELKKWYTDDKTQSTQYLCTTAVPLFRSAETCLNYIEAYYMRHGNLDERAQTYWRELRARAGVDTDFQKTVNATQLNLENDLAVWSKGVMVDNTLYNIRRERRCELIAEGLRLDDLKRWRALDKMVDYQPEGINLWGGVNKDIWGNELYNSTVVSGPSVSDYIHPLQASSSSIAYNGYTFPKQHYLEPIPLSEFLLVGSVLYQNPGWSSTSEGPADYSYDCD